MRDIKKDFLEWTKNHTVEILKDDGVYRHLKCSNNGSSIYRFDIVTWPGYLAYSGDMGEYMFTRLEDMFQFFRRDELKINTGYWGEKCVAGEIREWSSENFRDNINNAFEVYTSDLGNEEKMDEWDRIRTSILCYSDNEIEAVNAVHHYDDKYGMFNDFWECTNTQKTFRFVWCLYAIVWAIQQYDEVKVPGAV